MIRSKAGSNSVKDIDDSLAVLQEFPLIKFHISGLKVTANEGCITLSERRKRSLRTIGFQGIFYGHFLKRK